MIIRSAGPDVVVLANWMQPLVGPMSDCFQSVPVVAFVLVCEMTPLVDLKVVD